MGWFDTSLYPDVPDPRVPDTLGERIDFVARVCAAWDFGILPETETVREILRPEWREAVEGCQLLTCLSYHVLRGLHGLPKAEYLGPIPAAVRDDPNLAYV